MDMCLIARSITQGRQPLERLLYHPPRPILLLSKLSPPNDVPIEPPPALHRILLPPPPQSSLAHSLFPNLTFHPNPISIALLLRYPALHALLATYHRRPKRFSRTRFRDSIRLPGELVEKDEGLGRQAGRCRHERLACPPSGCAGYQGGRERDGGCVEGGRSACRGWGSGARRSDKWVL